MCDLFTGTELSVTSSASLVYTRATEAFSGHPVCPQQTWGRFDLLEPQFTHNTIWKHEYDRLWTNLCWLVVDEWNLKKLLLDLTLNASPVSFCSLEDAAKLSMLSPRTSYAPMTTTLTTRILAFQGRAKVAGPEQECSVELWRGRLIFEVVGTVRQCFPLFNGVQF